MHLLLVTYEFPPFMATGGIGSYMYHLAHVMAEKCHNVTVFSATQSHSEVTIRKKKEYTNYLIPASDTVVFRTEVLKLFGSYIQNHRVDVIESPEVGACALHIKEAYPFIPLVVKLHTPGVMITKISNTYDPFMKKMRYVIGALLRGKLDLGYWSKIDKNRVRDPEYKICIMADQLFSPSRALASYLSCFWHLKNEIKIVPNPFQADGDMFQYPLEGREKQICFVGKLTVLKGMFALTKAVKLILKKHHDYRFVFAGRDEAVSKKFPSMKAWMENELIDFSDRVEFAGSLPRDKVKKLLAKSRITIVPSLWENYPNIVLEAMASGSAVVAANRGGIPELIRHKHNGLLINPLQPNSIAKAVSNLINNNENCILYATKGREFVKDLSAKFEHQILNQYNLLLNHS